MAEELVIRDDMLVIHEDWLVIHEDWLVIHEDWFVIHEAWLVIHEDWLVIHEDWLVIRGREVGYLLRNRRRQATEGRFGSAAGRISKLPKSKARFVQPSPPFL